MPKQTYKTHFQDIWLGKPSFKGWILKHPTDNYMARCKVCSKDISIAAWVHARPGEPGGMSLFGKSQGELGEGMGNI